MGENEDIDEGFTVKIGDLVSLYETEQKSFLFADYVHVSGRPKPKEKSIENFQGSIFKIISKQEYAAQRKYNELVKKSKDNASAALQEQILAAKEAASEEIASNEKEYAALQGKKVFYGQKIQLIHFGTNMLLRGTKESAELGAGALKLALVPEGEGDKSCWFNIMPRFKVRIVGEQVKAGDLVMLEHYKTKKFVHMSDAKFPDGKFEVNLYEDSTGWKVSHFLSVTPNAQHENVLKGGDVIRLFHQEQEGFLRADVTPLYGLKEAAVYIKIKKDHSNKTRNSNTMWQIELQDSIKGGNVTWESKCRLKHMGTGLYLGVPFGEGNSHMILTNEIYKHKTLFKFHPIELSTTKSSPIHFGSYFRLECCAVNASTPEAEMKEQKWIHVNEEKPDTPEEFQKQEEGIEFDWRSIICKNKRHYEDVFGVSVVKKEEIDNLNFVNANILLIDQFADKLNDKSKTVLSRDIEPVKDTLIDLTSFCLVSKDDYKDKESGDNAEVPVHKANQNLLNEQQVIQSVTAILDYYADTDSYNKLVTATLEAIFTFLKVLVTHNKKAGTTFAQYLPTILKYVGKDLGVAECLFEAFSDNPKLLYMDLKDYIRAFIQLIEQQGRRSATKYLSFLSSLCTCNKEAVAKNQNYIIEFLLKERKDLLIHTEFDKDRHVVMVTTAVEKPVDLVIFVKMKEDGSKHHLVKFLKQQLVLFKQLTVGDNDHAIKWLRSFMTAEEVYTCLTAERYSAMPGSIRAAYCDLLYIFLGDHFPHESDIGVKYTWSYDEITPNYVATATSGSNHQENHHFSKIPEMKKWIIQYLKNNSQQKISDKEGSYLTQSVMTLTKRLVEAGVFESAPKHGHKHELIPHLLSFIDGQNDDITHGGKVKGTVRKTANGINRFQVNGYTLPVMEAKSTACEIIELYFDIRLENRISVLLNIFKRHLESEQMQLLKSATRTTAAIEHDLAKLPAEFAMESAAYEPSEGNTLQSILLDLSLYDYEPLVTTAQRLLLRHLRQMYQLGKAFKKVQLLTSDSAIKTFKDVSPVIAELRDILADNSIEEDQYDSSKKCLNTLIDSLRIKEGKSDRTIQLLFKNMALHKDAVQILDMPGVDLVKDHHMREVFGLTCTFIQYFVSRNHENQEILFEHIYSLATHISTVGTTVADAIIAILKDNHDLCGRVEERFVIYICKLIAELREPKLLKILQALVVTNGDAIKSKQNMVLKHLEGQRLINKNFMQSIFTGSSSKKGLTLRGKQLKESGTKMDDELLAREFSAEMIELLALLCEGDNHLTESDCQELIPLTECVKVIRTEGYSRRIQAALIHFISQVYFDTEQANTDVHLGEETWALMDWTRNVLRKSVKDQLHDHDETEFVFHAVIPMLVTFFDQDFKELPPLSKDRAELANDILDCVCQMTVISEISDNEPRLHWIQKIIEKMTATSHIEGFDEAEIDGKPIKITKLLQQITDKCAKLKETKLSTKKLDLKFQEAVDKLLHFEEFQAKVSAIVPPDEFDKAVGLYQTVLSEEQHANLVDKGKNPVVPIKDNAAFEYVLVDRLFKSDSDNVDLLCNCCKILSALILSKKGKQRRQKQTELCNMKCVEGAMDLLYEHNEKVRKAAVRLVEALLRGGNKVVQKTLYTYFTSVPDELFFTHMRSAFSKSLDLLKSLQQEIEKAKEMAETGEENNDQGGEGVEMAVMNLQQQENDEKFQKISRFVTDTLKILQSICQNGHRDLQNYMREQPDNAKSLDIVDETTKFGVTMIRYLHDPKTLPANRAGDSNLRLAVSLFNTLTEFCKGCPANQLSIVEAKGFTIVRRIFRQFALNTHPLAMELKVSVMEFLMNMLEGLYPSETKQTSTIPQIALSTLDLSQIHAAITTSAAFLDSWHLPGNSHNPDENYNHQQFIDSSLVVVKYLKYFDAEKTAPIVNEFKKRMKQRIKTIELIDESKEIRRVVFAAPEECLNLDDRTKAEFQQEVKRSSPADKVADFLAHRPLLTKHIMHRSKIQNSYFWWLVNDKPWKWGNLLLVVTFTINILMLAYYKEPNDPSGPEDYKPFPDSVSVGLRILSIIHIVLSLLQFMSFFGGEGILIIMRAVFDRHGKVTEDEPFHWTWLIYIWTSPQSVWYTIYLATSIAGAWHYQLYSLHLLDIIPRSPVLTYVLRAVTEHGSSLILTAFLALIIIYMYTMVGFFYLRSSYQEAGVQCTTLFNCWITTVNNGVRGGGGIGDTLGNADPDSTDYAWRIVFDFSFFILIIVIFINLIFGIIIDTFSELRGERDAIMEDIHNNCFICSVERDRFQLIGSSLKQHQKDEHSLWDYLYFFIAINRKYENDMPLSSLEAFVSRMIKANNTMFFPVGRSILVEEFESQN